MYGVNVGALPKAPLHTPQLGDTSPLQQRAEDTSFGPWAPRHFYKVYHVSEEVEGSPWRMRWGQACDGLGGGWARAVEQALPPAPACQRSAAAAERGRSGPSAGFLCGSVLATQHAARPIAPDLQFHWLQHPSERASAPSPAVPCSNASCTRNVGRGGPKFWPGVPWGRFHSVQVGHSGWDDGIKMITHIFELSEGVSLVLSSCRIGCVSMPYSGAERDRSVYGAYMVRDVVVGGRKTQLTNHQCLGSAFSLESTGPVLLCLKTILANLQTKRRKRRKIEGGGKKNLARSIF